MTTEDGAPLRPPPSLDPGSPAVRRNSRSVDTPLPILTSNSYQRAEPAAASRLAVKPPAQGSRTNSPGRKTPTGDSSNGVFSPQSSEGLPISFPQLRADDPRSLIARSFVPHVAVHVSADTDDIAMEKGFSAGFRDILRPFGELIHGKVTIRDSTGGSRSWDDFGIRFVGLGDGLGDPLLAAQKFSKAESEPIDARNPSTYSAALRTGGHLGQIEELVERHLSYFETIPERTAADALDANLQKGAASSATSSEYSLYLRRLLSGLPLSPHETFSHPVACVIAISSRNSSPIETLRQLYAESSRGDKRLPLWVNGEYLRYYVLVHDEEHDDFARSKALFEAMTRHFGLHCHLLRLRSSQCVPTDDDSIEVPHCEWISAAEELVDMQNQGYEDGESSSACLFDSDMTAIKTFVREMATQSIIPFMERCVTTWNDQVASRRKGISGRFMSLSRKWTGFGSSSRSTAASSIIGSSSSSNSNYDPLQGFYRPDTPEATMRKLADYAFMLRDWRLAYETYDLLRSDYNNDKAWKYYAGANEMAALSILLLPPATATKVRADAVDQMLDTASYSYMTRCVAPYSAVRCLALGVELLQVRGGSSADNAAKWGTRILELKALGWVGQALVTQRVAASYAARQGVGSARWGSRPRKSSMWNVLAAEAWFLQQKEVQAARCLKEAERHYHRLAGDGDGLKFIEMRNFVESLRQALQATANADGIGDGAAGLAQDEAAVLEVESEKLGHHSHRKSMSVNAVPFGGLNASPLSPARLRGEEVTERDDSFS